MHLMTQQNLMDAFAGESQAHMRYLVFAEQARKESLPNTSRLFEAIAYAEQVHATNHYRRLGHLKGASATTSMGGFGPGKTEKNLEIALEGEKFEVAEMYPAYLHVAQYQEEKAAITSFDWAWQAEQTHVGLYGKALEGVNRGQDPALGALQVCVLCGWTGEGEAPEICPICKAGREQFRTFP